MMKINLSDDEGNERRDDELEPRDDALEIDDMGDLGDGAEVSVVEAMAGVDGESLLEACVAALF